MEVEVVSVQEGFSLRDLIVQALGAK